MGSRIVCNCGEQVGINLFCGDGVFLLISDTDFDALPPAPVDQPALSQLVMKAVQVARCSACGRLMIKEPGGRFRSYLDEDAVDFGPATWSTPRTPPT